MIILLYLYNRNSSNLYPYLDFRVNKKLYFTESSDDNIYYETIIYYLILSLHNAKCKYRYVLTKPTIIFYAKYIKYKSVILFKTISVPTT